MLNREDEIEMFRRYNYLKYLACLRRRETNYSNPRSGLLTELENYLSQAEELKNAIIEANLRLVVSIARKHVSSSTNINDLVSEGNLSLMRAVEKFDYTRGFRFSTYASWAIAKDFARKIPAEASRPDRAGVGDMSNIEHDMRNLPGTDILDMDRGHMSLDEVIDNNLTKREQYIIRSHFGIEGGTIIKKAKTLKEIGETLNLTKERVRQIELVALGKLRHCLSDDEFDLLMG